MRLSDISVQRPVLAMVIAALIAIRFWDYWVTLL